MCSFQVYSEVIVFYICVYLCIYIPFQILFHYRLLEDILFVFIWGWEGD